VRQLRQIGDLGERGLTFLALDLFFARNAIGLFAGTSFVLTGALIFALLLLLLPDAAAFRPVLLAAGFGLPSFCCFSRSFRIVVTISVSVSTGMPRAFASSSTYSLYSPGAKEARRCAFL
jgi:hypothetical protein